MGGLICLGSTMVVRLFCKQGVVGSTPTQGSTNLTKTARPY